MSLDRAAELAALAPRGNAYLGLEPGTERFGDADGVFGYRASGRTLFVVGGLLGGTDLDLSVRATTLRQAAHEYGYRRALYFPVSSADRAPLREAGFDAVQTGTEALITPAEFTLAGKRHADLRQMCNRARKRFGLRIEEVAESEVATTLGPFFEAWRLRRLGAKTLRLVLGSPCVDRPLGRRYIGVWNDELSQPHAVVTLIPGWAGAGWGIDVMARHPEAVPGAMDLLLAEVAERLAAEGVEILSLGACPMRVPGGPGPHRLFRGLFRFLHDTRLGNSLFRFSGLSHFKAKFVPRWEPVYMGIWPRVGVWPLYVGCRMWGLFGDGERCFSV